MAKQKDGRYRAKITVGHVNGTPIVKYVSGRTKKELEANKEELLRTYVTGNTEIRRDVAFDVYAHEWYGAYKREKISESSRACYASIFNAHILPAFSGRQLRAITATDLQFFLNSKAGMSSTSLGYMKSILTGIFQAAYVHGIIDRDPSVGLVKPKATKESRRSLTEDETAAALHVGQSHPEGLLLLVLYYTGLRIGEALGLQWQDYDAKNGTLSIKRDIDFRTNTVGELKTKNAERVVPVPPPLADVLNSIRGFGRTFIIQATTSSEHVPQKTLQRRWNRLTKAMYDAYPSIEAKNGRSILTPHYFRHNYASVLYNADVDILSAQKYLGHADVKTTLQIYAHLSKEKTDSSAEKIKAAFSKNKKLPESCQAPLFLE